MAIVKRNESYPTWSNMLSEFFGPDWDQMILNNDFNPMTLPSVNIKEDEDGFDVEVAAPGMKKKDFKIGVEHGVLSISSEKEEEKEEKEKKKKFTRREYSYQSFRRSFTLPGSVDSDKISAKYNDGILHIHVPKKEEAKPKPGRLIDVD